VPSPNPERRSERARKAILAAALELSEDPGFQATSVEAIAKRAGVGKQTIYRWWPSKGAVVLEALHEMAGATLTFPDTGDVVADLNTQMTEVARFLASTAGGPLAGLIGAAQSEPALAKAMIETVFQPRITACLERLRAAQRQGQLRADVDIEEVMELLYGPLYYRLLLRTRAITDHQPAEILDLVFKGLAPGNPASGQQAQERPKAS
jgi:AcrR family transcriptional regulator